MSNSAFTDENRIAPFMWLHGEDHDSLVREIEAVYNLGIRSVCLESRTHEEFLQDKWWEDLRFIFSELKKRGMKAWILDDKHFPTGYAAGAYESADAESLRHLSVTEFHMDVPGNVKGGTVFLKHIVWPGEELIGVAAFRYDEESGMLSDDGIDITRNASEEALYFDFPSGMWRIYFIKKTRRHIPKRWIGYIDMLNPESVDLFVKTVYDAHYDNLSDEFGETFLGFFSDEPSFRNTKENEAGVEVGKEEECYPWSDGVHELFLKHYKEDAIIKLASLWTGFKNKGERDVRYLYMDYITKEYSKNFCGALADWCHEHNVSYIGHIIEDNRIDVVTGAGPGHYFRALDKQDMSGIDIVLSQILPGIRNVDHAVICSYKYSNHAFFKYMLAKLGSSMAHLDESKHGDAMCEIFGAFGWVEGTKMMKWLSDHMLVRGINYFVPHAFSPKKDDDDCPPVFYFTGNNPEYKYLGAIFAYLERCSKMLSGGKHKADCAILYDAEEKWMGTGTCPLEKVAMELYTHQIDFDIVPTDYFEKMSVEDGVIKINGEEFKALVVPGTEYIDKHTEMLLKKLKAEGASVVFVQDKPEGADFDMTALADISDYIGKFGRDVSISIENDDVHIYHYIKDGKSIYMLTNEGTENAACFTLDIGKKLSSCAMYDAMEDRFFEADEAENGYNIMIEPYNSVFLIEGACGEKPLKASCCKELNLTYEISLSEHGDEFLPYMKTDKLFNITGADGKPDFSGHIRYEAEFEAEESEYLIDLGFVGEIAEVMINGESVGSKVIPPYSFKTPMLKKGENKLTVTVTNSNVYKIRDRFSAYTMAEASGLLGPITIGKLLRQ